MARRGMGKEGRDALLKDCKVVPEELKMALKHLQEFIEPFTVSIRRSESRVHGKIYVEGLLSDLERKTMEPIAMRAGQHRRALQHFIGAAPWDHRPLLDELNSQVARDLGSKQGILLLDGTSFPKKGTESVGVARQWCGHLGKIDNCQVSALLGYVSEKGHALLDMRLYLPKEWTTDRGRLDKCHVPRQARRFKTLFDLSLEMLEARHEQIPHRWIVGDDAYGRCAPFRKSLRRMKEAYVLDVPSNTSIRDLNKTPARKKSKGRPRQAPWQTVRQWKEALSSRDWTSVEIRAGNKGPMKVRAARTRVQARAGGRRIGDPEWLLVVQTRSKAPETKYHLCHSGEKTSLKEMVHAANARYWIEDCFQRAKGKAGLDQYEVRSWAGWHHHVTLSMLALWFLVLEQQRISRKTPAITVPQTAEAISELLHNPGTDLDRLAFMITHRLRRTEQARIDQWRKFRRLPPRWETARAQHVYPAQ